MRVRIALTAAAASALFLLGAALAQELSIYDIVKKSIELDRAPTKVTTYQLTVADRHGAKKDYKIKVWEKVFPDGVKQLLRVTEPAEIAGNGLLTFAQRETDDQQWWFIAAKKKIRRLSAGDRTDKFLDSDFTFADFAPLSADKFEHRLVSEVVLNGLPCFLVESKPKPGVDLGYASMRSLIDTQTFVAWKREFYDKHDRLLKTLAVRRAQPISDIWTVMELVVTRADRGDAKTTLTLLERQYNVDIPDDFFTTQNLQTP
jgi:hypothetical protein